MLKNFYSHGLPETSLRPRWCRNEDPEKWWLPWEVHAILDSLGGHQMYQSGADLSHNTGVSIYRLYSHVLPGIDHDLGLVTGKWEDELFPEAWAIKGHTDSCTWGETTCDRKRYYSLTPRGQQWLDTLPARPRPPWWKKPTWWVGIVFWGVGIFALAKAFF